MENIIIKIEKIVWCIWNMPKYTSTVCDVVMFIKIFSMFDRSGNEINWKCVRTRMCIFSVVLIFTFGFELIFQYWNIKTENEIRIIFSVVDTYEWESKEALSYLYDIEQFDSIQSYHSLLKKGHASNKRRKGRFLFSSFFIVDIFLYICLVAHVTEKTLVKPNPTQAYTLAHRHTFIT